MKKLAVTSIVGACAVFFNITAFAFSGAPPQALLEKRASSIGIQYRGMPKLFLYERIKMVEDTFGIAICHEWHPALNLPGGDRDLPTIPLEKGMKLRDALDLIIADLKEHLRWETIAGSIVLVPVNASPTAMDLKISYRIEDASTWEALKRLILIVNGEVEGAKEAQALSIDFTCLGSFLRPPQAIRKVQAITLSLQEVTVREALCEILRLSPLNMDYNFAEHSYGPWVNIHFWGKDYVNRFDEPDLKDVWPELTWWKAQLAAVNPPRKRDNQPEDDEASLPTSVPAQE